MKIEKRHAEQFITKLDNGKYSADVNGVRFGSQSGIANYSTIVTYVKQELKNQITAGTFQLTEGVTEADFPVHTPVIEAAPRQEFSVDQKFQFTENLVEMVARRVQESVVITGRGGVGKTYTVLDTLKKNGYEDVTTFVADAEEGDVVPARSYIVVKGFSTAKGLYRLLHDNNGKVIIFDDCDSVLKDPVGANILKSALDSYSTRTIHWNADLSKNDTLPTSFVFTGNIIFISNMSQDKIDDAIKSRSLLVDLSMTNEQKIERMTHIIDNDEFLPSFSKDDKVTALDFIREHKASIKDINFRSLILTVKIVNTFKDTGDWEGLALSQLQGQM